MNTINHMYNWTQTRYIKLPDYWPSVPRSPLCPETSDSDSENAEGETSTMGHNPSNETRPIIPSFYFSSMPDTSHSLHLGNDSRAINR
ncbi:MAG: hypothetical protein LBE98_02445 [Puniceicoccales bacterium]|jgi:hypothetical protein|nr:hypothetical protein [Puniceicoccales bacterium]